MRGRRGWTGRDGQHIPVVIVGTCGDFGCFEGHRGRSLLARCRLSWKVQGRIGGHRYGGIDSGREGGFLELESLKVPFLAYWGSHKVATEGG